MNDTTSTSAPLTVVLVHSAFADAWIWMSAPGQRVVQELTADSYAE